MIDPQALPRRTFLHAAGAAVATAALPRGVGAQPAVLTKPIPKSGARIPAVGMGTWITFNVGDDRKLRDDRVEVMRTFLELGGGMVDSSPMYGSSEEVIGYCLSKIGRTDGLFATTKVWSPLDGLGRAQVDDSFRLWGVPRFDLFQVHNLLNWENHLTMLRELKEQGRIRHVGMTTSHGMRHEEMARIMETQDIDFVQLTYNAVDREAERRLLPLAADKGIAVVCNRPYRRGQLIDAAKRNPLPDWAAEAGIRDWPQFLLKFIVSHPAVTCAIPATTRVDHMRENMAAMTGPMPDAALRRRMAEHVAAL